MDSNKIIYQYCPKCKTETPQKFGTNNLTCIVCKNIIKL